ncbi:MAG: 7-carboxy-7-deazaguanine synthase [Sulfuritalea sp.]|nr:7-carboxy-7-deazaguanine synthase [Sulfuritalea sp.]
MSYQVKEIFYTLQGEGANAGKPAVFCRFAGCNLWSGRESDRASAVCQFCDTDFVGTDGSLGARYDSAAALAEQIEGLWPDGNTENRFVVLTGGEPLLQVDDALVAALHSLHFKIAVETNGSLLAPEGIDWICVSPKAGAPWLQRSGHELKLVWPQEGLAWSDAQAMQDLPFDNHYLQPQDNLLRAKNTEICIGLCLQHPVWNLSLQTHKITGIR